MIRAKEVIDALVEIKDKYIHSGNSYYGEVSCQAIEHAILLLSCLSNEAVYSNPRGHVRAVFDDSAFGTIEINGDELAVYLANVEVYPIGVGRRGKHKFTLIER